MLPRVPDRLFTNFGLIRKLNFTEEATFDDNVMKLQDIINDSQPQSSEERAACNIVMFLYDLEPKAFNRYISDHKAPYLILWTRARGMNNKFNLHKLVYIKWDSDLEQYVCVRHKDNEKK